MQIWFVHCFTAKYETTLKPILDGFPVSILEVSHKGIDTYVKLSASKDIADVLWDGGFHVSEA